MTGHEVAEVLPEGERLRRWRLVLGGDRGAEGTGASLSGRDLAMDKALAALYGGRTAGTGRRGAAVGRVGSAARPPTWRAGWATSARTSRRPSCR
ncbi:hypothetical protein GA0115246_113452 [Streptomyces sp. SolWspMP-sol7th]|nr:hypothetical protein GA0115246_113452 [Streptomyces sp. SolWspMP-sol7th]